MNYKAKQLIENEMNEKSKGFFSDFKPNVKFKSIPMFSQSATDETVTITFSLQGSKFSDADLESELKSNLTKITSYAKSWGKKQKLTLMKTSGITRDKALSKYSVKFVYSR